MSAVAWLVVLIPCLAAALIAGARRVRARVGIVIVSAFFGTVCLASLGVAVAHRVLVLAPLSSGVEASGPTVSWTLAVDGSRIAWIASILLAGLAAAALGARPGSGVPVRSQALGQLGLAGSLLVVLADDLALLFTGWALAGGAFLAAGGRLRCTRGRLAPSVVLSAAADLLLLMGILAAYQATGTLQVAGARLGLAEARGATIPPDSSVPIAAVLLVAAVVRSCVAAHVTGRGNRRRPLDRMADALHSLPGVLTAAYVAVVLWESSRGLGIAIVLLFWGFVLSTAVGSRAIAVRALAVRFYDGLFLRVLRGFALVLVHGIDEGLFHGWLPTGEGIGTEKAPDAPDRDLRVAFVVLGLLAIAVVVLALVEAPTQP